jgi:DNA-binding transcriptional LysR family regulator
MPEIHFSALDLNLLRVFDALAEEGGVTRAGARLGMTQSAVSHALGRLRHVLQDELFVRGPDGMRPTARAQEIAPRLRQGLDQLQQALAPMAFVPAETQRRFTLAIGGYVGVVLAPSFVAHVRREAPFAELRLQAITSALGDDLQSGRVDLAIGSFGRAAERFERETLFTETTVWALRAGHPAARGDRLTLETLASLPQVILATVDHARTVDGRIAGGGLERRVIWDDAGALENALIGRNWRRNVGLTVQDSQTALAVAGQTDMAALAPRRLANVFAAPYKLRLFDPPYVAAPAPLEALWRRDIGESAPLDWLRGCLRAAAASI